MPTTRVANGSVNAASGAKATWVAPALAEADYSVRVRAWDGRVFSPWTSFSTFALSYTDDGVEDTLGPNPELEMLEDASTTPAQSVAFDLPVDGEFTLTLQSDGQVQMTREGVVVGSYTANAVDDQGNLIDSSLSISGSQLIEHVDADASTVYPVVVVPTFTASDPTLAEVQEIYPAETMTADTEGYEEEQLEEGAVSTMSAQVVEGAESVDATERVEIVDDSSTEFLDDLQTLDDEPENQAMVAAASSSSGYVKVPKKSWKQKHYYFRRGRNTNPGWHDYCTNSRDTGTFNSTVVSYRGPCARHDLCIQWKQAPHRDYCDNWLKLNMRANCYARISHARAYRGQMNRCYGRASQYRTVVGWWTNKNTGPGEWGHGGRVYYPQHSGAPSQW